MKKLWILFFFLSVSISAQQYNTKKGAIANGYDVVAYFSKQVIKGNKKIMTDYDGVSFQFSSQKNLNLFNENPKKYIPQYGGFCAYAIGKTAERVPINPKTYEIRNGKLYLFYNSWGTNTLELWTKEGAEELKKQANKNWIKLNE